MNVVLVAYTVMHWDNVLAKTPYQKGNGTDRDELAEFAGRSCYQSWGRPNPVTATNQGYLNHILEEDHQSVLEHASATFYVTGVSRSLTHELIRHRHLSYSEVSQRYVDVSSFKVVVPPALRERFGSDMIPLSTQEKQQYNASLYELRDLPRKEGRQAARAWLPGATETKVVVTGNMRAWRYVIQKRNTEFADKEIQLFAQEVLRQLKRIAPNTFQDFE